MSDTSGNDPISVGIWRYSATVQDLLDGLVASVNGLAAASAQPDLHPADVELSIGLLNQGFYFRLVADPYTQSVWIQLAHGTGRTNTPPSPNYPTHV